jgi:hypothetical protein
LTLPVVELWRYPVKSLQGERLEAATVGGAGLVGDRRWAIIDEASGMALTGRREPALLFASARYDEAADTVEVTLPDGSAATDDAALSAWLGRQVRLAKAAPEVRGTYEIALDFEHEDTAAWVSWQGPAGSYHDSTKTQVSVLSTGSIRSWPTRRFRPNVVVDGRGEAAWVGSALRLGGEVTATVAKEIDRCVMVTRPQPGGVDRDLDVLRTIRADHGGNLGIALLVTTPGPLRVGDLVRAG